MGFVLSNYKLGYYDVHLLIDYEDNLKAIHLLGIEPHISMIAMINFFVISVNSKINYSLNCVL